MPDEQPTAQPDNVVDISQMLSSAARVGNFETYRPPVFTGVDAREAAEQRAAELVDVAAYQAAFERALGASDPMEQSTEPIVGATVDEASSSFDQQQLNEAMQVLQRHSNADIRRQNEERSWERAMMGTITERPSTSPGVEILAPQLDEERRRREDARQARADSALLDLISNQMQAAQANMLFRTPRNQPILNQPGAECSLLVEDCCNECGLRLNHRVECSLHWSKIGGVPPPNRAADPVESLISFPMDLNLPAASAPLPIEPESNYRVIRLPRVRCRVDRSNVVSVSAPNPNQPDPVVGMLVGTVTGEDGLSYCDVAYRADYFQPYAIIQLAREHWEHGHPSGRRDLRSTPNHLNRNDRQYGSGLFNRTNAEARARRWMDNERRLLNTVNPAGELAISQPQIGSVVTANGQPIGHLMGVDYADGEATIQLVAPAGQPGGAISMDFTFTPEGRAQIPNPPADL